MKKNLPTLAVNSNLVVPFKKLFVIGFALLISLGGFAHDVDGYTPTCASGPQYKIQPNVSNVNSSTNYRWQYRNASNVWVCLVNGTNVINGNSYNVTGAVFNSTTSPGALVFTNPTIGLDNLVVRLIMSDGSGVDPCTLPSGNTFNSSSTSRNFTIDVTGTPCGAAASIGDRVWLDGDADGIQDGTETGISGVTVQLKNSGGTVIATTTTNASGNYLFSGLSAGTYTVVFPATISGGVLTTQNVGADDNLDSDPNITTGATANIVVTATQAVTNVDAGYKPNNLALGNRVWYDTNNNGIDNTEDGIFNITVRLYKDDNNDNVADGAAIATTTTNATGNYSFGSLSPGNYIVGIIIPNGYINSAVNGGDPDNNINLDDNGQVMVGNEIRGLAITLVGGAEPEGSGRTNNTYDFGLLPDC
ncbi:MAG: SdrD B-like domain-containing protein, partial [Bacteroidota bacterium]